MAKRKKRKNAIEYGLIAFLIVAAVLGIVATITAEFSNVLPSL